MKLAWPLTRVAIIAAPLLTLSETWPVGVGTPAGGVKRVAKAGAGLEALKARAAELADETLAALEDEIAPDMDRVWQLHVEGSKLISAYYARAVDAQRTAGQSTGNNQRLTDFPMLVPCAGVSSGITALQSADTSRPPASVRDRIT